MIKNLTLFLAVIAISTNIVIAQNEYLNCSESEENAICDLGDINGYQFSNAGGGDIPDDALCDGGAFHNPGWFSFVAGSTDIILTVVPQPGTCDTVMGNTGVQVALWEGCPGGGGDCVAGDAACNDQPITLEAVNLVVGEIYNLVIDGCSGSVCTVAVSIDNADAFELPSLQGVDMADPEYNVGRGGGCDNSLGDGNFCSGLEVLFSLEDDFYETLGAEWTWTVTGPDVGGIEWSFGSYEGMGSPIEIGDLDGELGANGVNIVFPTNGTYTICLDNVVTECDADADGPICTEVNIISPGDQEFGEYDVCVEELLAGWEPPEPDPNGNPWIAPPITYDDVINAPDGRVEIMTQDDCGCDFTQIVSITPRGSIDRAEVELFIWECMLPYEWYEDEFIDLESLPEGDDFDLAEGSAESDYEGEPCDSLITLTITPLTALDTVIVGDCTSDGTEFTFVFTALDSRGNEVEVEVPMYEWIDATTGMVVATTQTAILETGSYFINMEAFIQDLNYMEDELAGLEPIHDCVFLFGPYDLEGGTSTSPDINAYDQVYCEDELDLLTFSIDTVVGTEYNWIIPPSYNVLFQADDSLAVSIDTYVPTDTLFVTAANGCGGSDSIPLPIMVVSGPEVDFSGQPDDCVGQEYLTGYAGDQTMVQSYFWEVTGGMITTGNQGSANIGVTYSAAGNYDLVLTVTDLDGCTSSETYEVSIEDILPNPEVECGGDPSQIVFTWQDVPGATDYDIQEINIPAGATGTRMGNSYVITNVNGGDMATIVVTSLGSDCVEPAEEITCEAPGCDFTGLDNMNFEDFVVCRGDDDNMPIQFEITLPTGYTGVYSGNGVSSDGLFDPDSPQLNFGPNNLFFDFMDATGCSQSIQAVVSVFQLPNATFTPTETEFCVGETIVLSGAASQGVYDYDSGAIGDFSGLSYATSGEKTISVTVTDQNSGCEDEFEIMVNVLDTVPAPLITCIPGTSTIDFEWDSHPLAADYELSIVKNGGVPTIVNQSTTSYQETGLMEGDVIELTVSVTSSNGCNTASATESCTAKTCIIPDIVLTVSDTSFCNNQPLTPVVIVPTVDGFAPAAGTFEYVGNGVTVDMGTGQATFDPATVTPGVTPVTFRYTNPVDDCVTTERVNFEVVDVLIPDYTVDMTTICLDDVVTVTMEAQPASITNRAINTGGGELTFTGPDEFEVAWDVAGTFDIFVAYTTGDCPEERVLQTITVLDTIESPRVSCPDVETDLIMIGWQDQTDVTEYELYVDNVLVTTLSDSEFTLTDLDPDQIFDIRVVAIDDECGDKEGETQCATNVCPDISFNSNIPNEICYEAGSGTVALDITGISANMEAGELSWMSTEVDQDGNFTPGATTQDYNLTARYTVRNCFEDTTISIRVNVIPPAQLELLSGNVICVGSSVTVQSNFQALAGETPIWDFGGGTESGTNFGPYDVTFDTPGVYDISLQVDNSGCLGSEEMVQITVEEELLAPEVMCSSTDINEISVTWDAIDCASEYRVLVDNTEYVVTDQTSTTITGLVENQQVDIIIEAISECACNNVLSQTFQCSSKECIEPTWAINVPSEICYELGTGPIIFDVTATSNDTGTGVLSWPDSEVDDNGSFTPASQSQDYSFTVLYNEGECQFDNTVNIRVNIVPSAELELQGPDVICEGESVSVISNYQASGGETPMWDFDGGTSSGTGFGPNDVRFDTPGNYQISLAVDNAGCIGDTEVLNIEVQANLIAPVVSCDSDDISEIELSWNSVDCAGSYNVIVDGSQVDVTSNTNYTLSGLQENQEVEVVIEAISECACDNVMSMAMTCNSKPCDQTSWSFSSNTLTEVCLDANAQPFTITATPDDLTGNGSGQWSGAAISDPSGVVDPSLVTAGTYDFVYTYEEGGCFYTAPALQLTFVAEPELLLEAMDPACPMDITGTISATGSGGEPGYQYALDGGAFQSSGVFSDVAIGGHSIEIIDNNGCINTADIQVFAPQQSFVEIVGPGTVISENDAVFELDIENVENIEDIIWSNSNGDILCQGINCTTYTEYNALGDFDLMVEIIYNGGCSVISELFVVDVKEIQAYYIPNVVSFTADNGVNSQWKIFIKGNETAPKSIKVYDRWGNLLHDEEFALTLPVEEVLLWDGYSGDNQVDSGVYVYALEIEIEDRTEFIVGDITIIR